MCVCVYVCICLDTAKYIYIYRERDRKRHRERIVKSLAQKKLPKWLRNICTTKKCVFNFGK